MSSHSRLRAALGNPWLVSLVLFAVAFLPRAVAAGAYVTVDEQHWLARSVDFVTGVSNGFEKQLEIVGVGYRAEKSGEKLIIRVGYSHPVEVVPLPGITLSVEGNNRIKVTGIDKEAVGEMAARIRKIRPPDAYKGKGIRYAGEIVHLKPGKAGKVVGKK